MTKYLYNMSCTDIVLNIYRFKLGVFLHFQFIGHLFLTATHTEQCVYVTCANEILHIHKG